MAPRRTGLLCLAGAAAAYFFSGSAFCGGAHLPRSGAATQRNGWRLDKIEVGPQGIGQLVITEGFFIGEKDLEAALNAKGHRYRLRATKEEVETGADALSRSITQIGPVKIRLYEIFGGSGWKVGKEKPVGYRGFAGSAGWDTEPEVMRRLSSGEGYGKMPTRQDLD
eukprot:TRINITY_DN1044_c0_g5_i1.p1 TRINITY_DN1044_c0_g5~~TRINITY_DN1044_c0_g5_i1.p1  ORF type:complete len:185 (-),score=45.24 TRINITY_DN1044_c0_g5_i1:89-589(-)